MSLKGWAESPKYLTKAWVTSKQHKLNNRAVVLCNGGRFAMVGGLNGRGGFDVENYANPLARRTSMRISSVKRALSSLKAAVVLTE